MERLVRVGAFDPKRNIHTAIITDKDEYIATYTKGLWRRCSDNRNGTIEVINANVIFRIKED